MKIPALENWQVAFRNGRIIYGAEQNKYSHRRLRCVLIICAFNVVSFVGHVPAEI